MTGGKIRIALLARSTPAHHPLLRFASSVGGLRPPFEYPLREYSQGGASSRGARRPPTRNTALRFCFATPILPVGSGVVLGPSLRRGRDRFPAATSRNLLRSFLDRVSTAATLRNLLRSFVLRLGGAGIHQVARNRPLSVLRDLKY